ncbi:MAG: methyl-accepting chemotaxis protein [Chloroflexi bacterium]|nr:methyl-accepting chemotaxis protein [Chloroflexota bacterium]
MWIRIRQLIAVPVFEDEDTARVANLLNVISLVLLALAILGTALVLMREFALSNFVDGVITLLLALGVQYLMRRDRVWLASVIQSFVFWLMVSYLSIIYGGIRADTVSCYILAVVMSGLLLGSRVGFGVAGMSVVVTLAMVYAESIGKLPPHIEPLPWITWVSESANFILVAVMVHVTIRSLHDALERAHSSNRELQAVQKKLEQRMAIEQEQHEELQHSIQSEREQWDRLRRIFTGVRKTTSELGASTAEIQAAATQQAAGASEQSAAIAQTTTTVDELKTIADQSVKRAHEVADASQRTVDISRMGQRAVDETIGSMAQIKARVEGIAENILVLSEQTQQIGEIISTVNDIAAQSNILALNASVEAARAGEYGKGFAVVAVEVRNLAEQSRQATAQVKAILSDIQKATNTTVMATEEGTKGVEEGLQLAAQAGDAIEQLAGVIEESAQAATQMVAGGRQQSAGVEQIAVAMQNINQVTVQNLASTRQTEKAAKDVNTLADGLIDIVEQL